MVEKYADMLAQGLLPTEVVAPMLRKLMEAQDDFDWESSLPRILSRWENETHAAEFSSVDDAFCSLGSILWWREIEELYYACNIDGPARIRGKMRYCERAGCTNRFEAMSRGGNKKRFCSENCRNLHVSKPRGKRPKKPRGKRLPDGRLSLLVYECVNGHPRTPENTATQVGRKGQKLVRCRVCAREKQRELRAKKRESRVEV